MRTRRPANGRSTTQRIAALLNKAAERMTIPNVLIDFLMATGDLILIALAMASRGSRTPGTDVMSDVTANRHEPPPPSTEASERDLRFRWRSGF